VLAEKHIGARSGGSCIAVVQAAQHRDGAHRPLAGYCLAWWGRDPLLHALVRPGGVEGEHELPQDAPEVGLAEDEPVVQALPLLRAQTSLADRVLFLCPRGRGYQVDTGGFSDADEGRPVRAVMVEDEGLGVLAERSGFAQLLGHSGVGRGSSDADGSHATRAARDQEEGVEWPEEPVGDREEVGGPEVAAVLGPEGGPRLARAARRMCPPQRALDGRLGDPDRPLEPLSSDALGAPGAMADGQLADQGDRLEREGRPVCWSPRPRLPPLTAAEELARPAQDGSGWTMSAAWRQGA
jgi:hypothetical protein